jgi:hypothetical protein
MVPGILSDNRHHQHHAALDACDFAGAFAGRQGPANRSVFIHETSL